MIWELIVRIEKNSLQALDPAPGGVGGCEPVVHRLPWEEAVHTRLLTPGGEPMTEYSTETTRVHLSELMSVIGVTYRNMGEGLLT